MSDSTLQRLRNAARKVAREYGVDEMRAFEDVGLILTELKHCGYSQAPRNTLAFAHTGGDGVHFSFLPAGGNIDDNTPVLMTVPMNPDAPNIVVGKNLHDFLCLGCVTGYFFLEQLSYQGEQYLDKILDYEKHLQEVYADEEAVEGDREDLQVQQEKLAFLSKELGLKPWADPVDKFTNLQAILGGQ